MASPSQKPDKSFKVGWRGGLYTQERVQVSKKLPAQRLITVITYKVENFG